MGDARFQQLLEALESSWQRGEPPNLDDLLPIDEGSRAAALIELIRAAMNRRGQIGQASSLLDYLTRVPALRKNRAAVLALVG